jgi:hypothetical protein
MKKNAEIDLNQQEVETRGDNGIRWNEYVRWEYD